MMQHPIPTNAATAKSVAGEYLSFRLDTVEYGIDILKVQEIRSYANPTHIANAPRELLGVINLRGVIVPIIDLRLKLHCPTVVYTASTVVIVLNLRHKVIGVVVDSVSDVVQLEPGSIKPPPDLHTGNDASFITGLANLGDRMLILVDTESILGTPELSQSPTFH